MAAHERNPRQPRWQQPVPLRRHTRLGKYRIIKKLDTGGFADVFAARDLVQGIDVALKLPRLPHPSLVRDLRREVRLVNRLDHPNVVRVWNADEIDGHFLIAYELGTETLADRLRRPLAVTTALRIFEQVLEALRYAHERRIMHLDVKPENIILFGSGAVRLGDFGISRVAAATRASQMSAAGTLGYMAPEQAYGLPTMASDVFAAGLIFYRMLSGRLPTWPFRWPFPGHDRFRQRASADLQAVTRRATAFDPERRYADAEAYAAAFHRAVLRHQRRRAARRKRQLNGNGVRWRLIRAREFRRLHGASMGPFFDCHHCNGPVIEAMQACPWCGADDHSYRDVTPHPRYCPDCERGIAADWRFCPWCYGAGFKESAPQRSAPRRGDTGHCSSSRCRGPLPTYARYCPWCRSKVRRAWKAAGLDQRCGGCGGEVAGEFWRFCPWCSLHLHT
jgi:serine/threonine-protein kinase